MDDASEAWNMETLIHQIAIQKTELDRIRLLSPRGQENLNHVLDLELTYTSNAIEGNTLSAAETTLVIEKGITIGGKPLKDHMEAIDHHDAIRYVRELARKGTSLTEFDVRHSPRPYREAFQPRHRRPLCRSGLLCPDRQRTPCLPVPGGCDRTDGRLRRVAWRESRHTGGRVHRAPNRTTIDIAPAPPDRTPIDCIRRLP